MNFSLKARRLDFKRSLREPLRFVVVLTLVFSLSVGTSVLQMVAWATMIPTQLVETGSVQEAVQKTFSGDFPCAMCELAALKAETEKKNDSQPLAPNSQDGKQAPLVLFSAPSPRTIVCPPREMLTIRQIKTTVPASFSEAPETPPPDLG